MGVGVHVGRGAWVGRGVDLGTDVVVLVLGDGFVRVVVLEEVLLEVVVLEVVVLDLDELDEVLEGVGLVDSLVSWSGRSSTGGGSDGAAATRKPKRTSSGTQSMAARSMPSRPMRRRGFGVMGDTLEKGDEPRVRSR